MSMKTKFKIELTSWRRSSRNTYARSIKHAKRPKRCSQYVKPRRELSGNSQQPVKNVRNKKRRLGKRPKLSVKSYSAESLRAL